MRKKKSLKPVFLLLALLITLPLLWYVKYRNDIYKPVDKEDNTNISFQIKKGESAKNIGKSLEEKDLIKNSTSFYIYAKNNKLDQDILFGRFVLNRGMTVPEIITMISDPSQAEFVITIQEGLTIKDIDQKLVDLGLISAGDFLTDVKNFNNWQDYDFLDQSVLSKLELPLEGYLYPDTYFLDPENFTSEELIYKALDNFENKFKPLKDQIKRHSYHEIITMASIIEKEVFGTQDRKLVSGILWKRLESNWPLGADATSLYIKNDRSITGADLQTESPYNTRKNLGLPPGPIANPSIESIEAAMYPTESDYWFYLTTLDTGEVIYAKSNEEHNANRAKYL